MPFTFLLVFRTMANPHQRDMSLDSTRAFAARSRRTTYAIYLPRNRSHRRHRSRDSRPLHIRSGRNPPSQRLQPRIPRRVSDELVRDWQVQLSDLSGCVLQFRTEAGREWKRRGGNGGLGGEWPKETRCVKMVVTVVFGLEHWFMGYDLRGYDTRGGVFGTGLIRQ